jgi:PAS domain S-box-containing protein
MDAERLYTLLANIPDVVWTTDSQGRTTFISPNVEQVYGFTADEILQAGSELWLDRIHPDDIQRVREAYESLLTRDEMFDVEYRTQHRDGHWIWLHDRATVSYDRDGVRYADGVFSDVTARVEAEAQRDAAREALQRARDELEQRIAERTAELRSANASLEDEIAGRKRTEQALDKERKFVSTVLDTVDALVVVLDRKGRIVRLNRTCEEASGYSLDEVKSKYAWELFASPAQVERIRTVSEDLLSGKFPIKTEDYWLTRDGESWLIDWTSTVLLDEEGSVDYIISTGIDVTEHRLAQGALLESQERYRALFADVPVGVYQSTPSGALLNVNPAMVTILGYPDRETLLAVNATDMYANPADRVRWQTLLEHQGTVQDFEIRVRRYDGTVIWVLDAARAVKDSDGRVVYYEGSLQDITERKQAEEALWESREALRRERNLLSAVLDTVGALVVVLDREGRIVRFNQACKNTTGYTFDEMRGKYVWARLLVAEEIEPVKQVFKDLQSGQFPNQFENDWVTKDGERRLIAWTNAALVDDAGSVEYVIGTGVDITERRWAEEALRESEARFRELFERAPLCIFELDLTQELPVVLRANRQATRVYGWSSEEFASIPLPRIVPPRAIVEFSQVVDALREGRALTVESVNRRRDEAEFPVRISAAAELDTDLSRIIMMVEDITIEEERRSEEEAIAEERRRIAREIHDGLAQDLAALRVRVGLWHDLVDGDPAQMHVELDALQSLLRQNIRDVRRSIFALRPISLDELGFYPAIQRFVREFGEQHQLHVDLQILGPQDRLLPQWEPMLFRIIQEALNNVGKHAQAASAWIELDMRQVDTIRLTVRDDGVGFDPGMLSQAVQRGHIGLTQMRERIEQIGGEIEIESRAGKGTAICVALPASGTKGGQ